MPMPAVYASDFTGWTKLTDEYSGKSLESGNYYLDSDVTLSDTITIKAVSYTHLSTMIPSASKI